ncbi:MAG: Gfo/Idh/MocA family oxidoreductase [Clostridia bacterium]|nr:Gfo/Idh/MocA family oxidoreductase [Clostridia bacterium]
MKQLKIGIFGTGRGCDIAENFRLLGCEITALCDFNPDRLAAAAQRLGGDIAQYQDFDSFIEHDMDAVVLANYFHEHAPYAIRCFERGIHVFSECISNGTMAEGVELVRAFEKYP